MSKPSWYRQGSDEELETKPEKKYASRFWMKKGEEAYITFCDENPIMLYEHSLKIGQKFGFHTTCMKNIGEPCPLCDNGHYASDVAIFTIIDHREIKGKDGKVYQDQKKLFVAKATTWAKLKLKKKRIEEKGIKFTGAMFLVTRTTGDKSPATGDDFEFEENIAESGVDLSPIDYDEFLAPDAEYCAYMAKKAGVKTDDDFGGTPAPKASKPSF